MKILVFKGAGIVAPYIIKDCIEGLQANGHELVTLRLSGEKMDVIDCVHSHNIDCVFAIDGKGLDVARLSKAKIPHMSWFVDNPFYFLKSEDQSAWHHVFVWDQAYIPELKRSGFQHVHYLPLCTNPRVFKPSRGFAHHENVTYQCDVSFCGTMGQHARSARKERYDRWGDDAVNALLDEGVQRMKDNPRRWVRDVVFDLCRDYSKSLTHENRIYLEHKIDQEFSAHCREVLVQACLDQNIQVYGDEGWNLLGLPDGVYQGSMDYHRDLAHLYASSRINLNITRPQLPTTVNQRVFDAFAAGGFVLTDARMSMGSLFGMDCDPFVFHHADELREKIRYYLEHPQHREQIVLQMRDQILKHHTYHIRMADMCGIFTHSMDGLPV